MRPTYSELRAMLEDARQRNDMEMHRLIDLQIRHLDNESLAQSHNWQVIILGVIIVLFLYIHA